jgi:predicted nucleic acid-binding protein
MLIIESWLDPHPLKINENDLKTPLNRFDKNEIQTLVSKCILDELNGKFYNSQLGIQLSENISKHIRRELAEKCKFYKIIIQTFVGQMSNEKNQNFHLHNFKLYASYHFDQQTDKCISIIENNGQM